MNWLEPEKLIHETWDRENYLRRDFQRTGERFPAHVSPLMASDGFSLVELMVAVLIFAIGFLAAAQLFTMTIGLDMLMRSKNTAALAAQNELERLADLYRRNSGAAELAIGAHQAEKLVEILNPLTQNVLNRYKITWLVSEIPDPRPGTHPTGRVISVRATPISAGNANYSEIYGKQMMIFNAVIVAEP